MKKITTRAEWEEMGKTPRPVCVLFTSEKCRDCRIIKPALPGLEEQFKGKLEFINVDREECPKLYDQEEIIGIPSFIIFHRGEQIHRWVSTLTKTREEIEAFMNEGVRRIEKKSSELM